MEPFWGLKIHKYVEYLTHISSEYIISSVLPSLTSTARRTSRVFLDYVIPWINKASLALYIAHIAQLATIDRSEVRKLHSAVEFVLVIDRSIEICHFRGRESVSESISAIEAPACGTVYVLYWRPFTTCTVTTMQLLGRWSRVSSQIEMLYL